MERLTGYFMYMREVDITVYNACIQYTVYTACLDLYLTTICQKLLFKLQNISFRICRYSGCLVLQVYCTGIVSDTVHQSDGLLKESVCVLVVLAYSAL